MTFKFLLLVFYVSLAACVQLTPAGAQMRILKEKDREQVLACQLLGKVSVSSEDALRNATAALSGDTALMQVKDVAGSLYIRGTVYRCGLESSVKKTVQEIVPAKILENPTLPVNLPPKPTQSDENNATMQKVTKCKGKGGRWIDSQCMVAIELD